MVRAAERLRSQHSKAGHVTVYLHTNPFRLAQPQYARSGGCTLAEPTSATGSLITAAHQLLARLFRPGYQYHRAGVFLQGLVSDTPTQLSLFSTPEQQAKQQADYTAVDAIFPVIEHINKLEGYPVFFLLAKPIEACRHGIY